MAGEGLLQSALVQSEGRVVRGRVQRSLGPVRAPRDHLLHPRLRSTATVQAEAQLIVGREVEGGYPTPRRSNSIACRARIHGHEPPESPKLECTTAPSSTASCTALSPSSWAPQRLNTRLRTNTTITVAVMLDPKMTWKFFGNLS